MALNLENNLPGLILQTSSNYSQDDPYLGIRNYFLCQDSSLELPEKNDVHGEVPALSAPGEASQELEDASAQVIPDDVYDFIGEMRSAPPVAVQDSDTMVDAETL